MLGYCHAGFDKTFKHVNKEKFENSVQIHHHLLQHVILYIQCIVNFLDLECVISVLLRFYI